VGWHIFRENASGTDNRKLADGDAAKNRRSRADRRAAFDVDRLTLPFAVTFGHAFIICRAWVTVVDERDAVSDEHLVVDCDSFANEGVARDFAAVANLRALLDFDEC